MVCPHTYMHAHTMLCIFFFFVFLVPFRNCGTITCPWNSRRLETVVSVERGIFTFDFGSARRFYHCILDDWPDLLCIGEYYIIIRSFAGKFSILFWISKRVWNGWCIEFNFIISSLQSDLLNMTIYDLAYEEDHSDLYNVLSNPSVVIDPTRTDLSKVNQICFSCHLKRGGVDYREDVSFELVQFVGYFRKSPIPCSVLSEFIYDSISHNNRQWYWYWRFGAINEQ